MNAVNEKIAVEEQQWCVVYDPWTAQEVGYFRSRPMADLFLSAYLAWKDRYGRYAG